MRRAALAALTALVVGACSSPAVVTKEPVDDDGMHAIVLPRPYRVPPVTLTDTAGKPFAVPGDLDGDLTLVFFGYTHCDDVCQLVMANLTAALARLPEAERERVDLVFVTSDPARDTPKVLGRYLGRFDPSFDGLTGDLATITELGTPLGVRIEKGARLASGGYDVSHGTQVVGVRPDGSAPLVWDHDVSSQQLAEDLDKALTDGIPKG